ncbi:MAG: hypothetical protein KC466_08715 [Myxococcales bacterium]|nr:hypothetical protein [Myxococcales bacterium]
MFIFFSFATEVFLTTRNLQNVVTQVGPIAVAATGITFGKVGGEPLDEIPYVRGVATLDPAGRVLTVTLTNTHAGQAIDAIVDLGAFTPGPSAEVTTVGGEGPEANNEPEADVCSHPGPMPGDPCDLGVVPAEATIPVPGSSFTISLPPSSLTFVRIPAAGADTAPPPAPTALVATGDPAAGGLALDWQWSGGEPVTFDVYRSHHWEPSDRSNEDPTDTTTTACVGPWRHRLNAAPLTTPTFVDATVDPGEVYCYGVRAVDAAGNESDMAVLRRRATTSSRLVVETIELNPGATILYGSTIGALIEDLPPVNGQPLDEDFLVVRPVLSQQIPPVGRDLDAVLTTAPFTGDPAALLGLDLVVSFRFKTPLFVPHAEVSIRNFAAGGAWEPVIGLDPIGPFSKSARVVRRLNAADYLSPEGRVELRFNTNDGDPYAELFVEHVKVVMESL